MSKAGPVLAFASLAASFTGCGSKAPTATGAVAEAAGVHAAKASEEVAPAGLVGHWRMEVASPGGPLPFELDLRRRPEGYVGEIINGEESLPLSAVTVDDKRLQLSIAHYDSKIEGELSADSDAFTGTWTRRAPEAQTRMQVTGARAVTHRFVALAEADDPSLVAGDWRLDFTEDDGSEFAGHAVLRAEDDEVRGTILTDTGDYRFLEGQVVDGELRLSVFDGAHAFLFRAKLGDERSPSTLRGDFWSRDTYHASFKGERAPPTGETGLANPFEIVALTSDDGRLRFEFPKLGATAKSETRAFRHDDPSLEGKVVIVDIFGTWCPNCNDQAPLLAEWHREFGPRGLQIVGIAFEFTGEPAQDLDMLARYRDKYAIEYPLLLGGTSDKKLAGEQLPDLSRVAAYPTTVFIGRDGKVAKIYSGFSGPATGERHTRMLEEHRGALENLLAAPRTPTAQAPAHVVPQG